MPPQAHALLSASSAHRWLHCPPSAKLTAGVADAPSEAALQGTGGNNQPLVLNAYGFNPIHKDENNSGRFGYATEVSKTLDTKGIIPTCNQGGIAVVAGLKKTRSRKQVRAWLADPVSDTGLYKLWGNGVALPVVEHILHRLATLAG